MNVPDGQAIFHNLNQHHEYFCIWKGDTSLRYGEIILEKYNIAMMNYKDKLQQDISIMIVRMIFSFDRMCSTHIAGSIPPTQFPGLRKNIISYKSSLKPTSILSAFWKRIGFDVAHPGVDKTQDPLERRYHKYYQWVCFCLFFQVLIYSIFSWFFIIRLNGTSNSMRIEFTRQKHKNCLQVKETNIWLPRRLSLYREDVFPNIG